MNIHQSQKHISKRGYLSLRIIMTIMYLCMVFVGICICWETVSRFPEQLKLLYIGSTIFLWIFLPVLRVWTTVVVAKYIDVPKWYYKTNKINWILVIMLSIIIYYVGIVLCHQRNIYS